MWPETIAAIREALAQRPEPRVRLTKRSRTDRITVHFAKLLKTLDLHHAGMGFYSLRHIHRTISDSARDPVACDVIMGHADPSMAANYRERIDDNRLVAVAEHIRQWLFGNAPDGTDRESRADGTADDAQADVKTQSVPVGATRSGKPKSENAP